MSPVRLARFALMLFALFATAPAMAADITFTGLVTYRERMALPSDASLIVNLVALPGQQRVTGAQANLGGKAGSPIQFTLNVRSEALSNGGRFGLVAEIWSQGSVIFRNSEPVLVNPRERDNNVIEVRFTPPSPPNPPEPLPPSMPNPLLDTVWTLTSIGGDPALALNTVSFSIAADLRAGGNGGCNNYFTEASVDGSALSFGPVAGTRMACAPDVMMQETRFFAALAATRGYELVGNTLKLVDAAGVPLAGLVRAR